MLAVLGVAFPLLALALTRRTPAESPDSIVRPGAELAAVLAYLALFALVFLGPGLGWVRQVTVEGPQREVAELVAKLTTMVALPAAVLFAFGHRPRTLLA